MSCLVNETFFSVEQNLYLYDEFVQHNFCGNNLKEIKVKLTRRTFSLLTILLGKWIGPFVWSDGRRPF